MRILPQRAPSTFSQLGPVVPTVVYESFWRFAAERQRVFFAKLQGMPFPWSQDPILQRYKFTNVYRASDRVSQFLIRNVAYSGCSSAKEVFFRTIVFKLFNKIDTWWLLEGSLGKISASSYRYSRYERTLSQASAAGLKLYSAAYIMASGHRIFGVSRKHQAHLKLIELMLREAVPERLADCTTMREGFDLLRSYPLIGDFLAYQLITDLNYSELTNFSEMEFTMPGPGAFDGIHKCFSDVGGFSEADVIRLVTDRQEAEFERLGLSFQDLWGRRLQLIDVQNLFCEISKYARIKHPNVIGRSGRTRIKRLYKPTSPPIEYFFPPKWKVEPSRLEDVAQANASAE